MTLGEKLGIIENIKRLKQKGGHLCDFVKFGVIKTNGSSDEIHEWLDSFIKPLDEEMLERYYHDPQLFFDFGRKNMEIVKDECEALIKYGSTIFDESFSQEERDTAFLMVLHLTFTITDTFYQHDRLLEVFSPELSPLGKIYEDIREIVDKIAKLKGYSKEWQTDKISLLLSMPHHLSFQFRLLSETHKLLEKYPSLKDALERNEREKALSLIEKNSKLYDEIRAIANKYYLDIPSLIEAFLSSKITLGDLENIKKNREKDAKKVESLFHEFKPLLDIKDYKKLKESYEKIKFFKDLQEFTAFKLASPIASKALETIISVKDYLKMHLPRLIKEEHQVEINLLLQQYESALPFGVFYFFPKLRQIIYLMLKQGYLKDEIKKGYDEELKLWRGEIG